MRRIVAALIFAIAALNAAPTWATFTCPDLTPTFATTYYICDCQTGAAAGCVAGNDSTGSGTSGNPYKTLEKARTLITGSGSNGIAVLGCRGGWWDGTGGGGSWINNNCGNPSHGTTAPGSSQWCGLGSYVASWNSGGEGPPHGGHFPGFDLSNGSSATEQQAFVVSDWVFTADGIGVGGVDTYNDFDYLEFCSVEMSGFQIAGQVGDDNGCGAGSDGHSSHNHFHNINFHDNTGQGILGADIDTYVSGTVARNGTRSGLDHNLYLGTALVCNTQAAITDVMVDHVTSYQNDVSSGICTSAHLVSHGNSGSVLGGIPTIDRFTVQDSYFYEPGGAQSDNCWGATADSGDNPASGEWTAHAIFRRNRFENLGNLSTGCGSCTDPIFENNVVVNGANQGGVGIEVPDKWPEGASTNAVTTRVTLRNNTVYQDTGQCYEVSGASTGNVLYNNVCQINATGTVGGFRLPNGASAYTSDYNFFYAPNATTRYFELTGSMSLASWQAFSSGDSHSVCCTTNPGFATPAYTSYNFAASSSGSAIVNAGSASVYAALDIAGVTRPQGAAPDIGAYEFVSPAAAIGRAYLFFQGGGI